MPFGLTVPEMAMIVAGLPLAAFAVQIAVGRRLPRHGDWVALAAIAASFAGAVLIFRQIVFSGGGLPASWSRPWIDLAGLVIRAGVHVDTVAAIMLVVVTLVSLLVHLYSVGYMHGDQRYSRFFAYLGLFSFSMLGLVIADNLFFLFVFWELVGVSSYLLIGFWFEKPSAADACKKAFLANRVGDAGFFIGILTVFVLTGELAFAGVFEQAKHLPDSRHWLWTFAGICLFGGAIGKSAQFPLHVWLPDAMEGPTPVSALIHAATMVAAGVYMVARILPILTPEALSVVIAVGAATAVLAASIALVQNDIKKILAYSTISQLGYMILALGVGGYVAGLFHLVTHAAFKACLFLGAGSVIHAVHTQDIQKMGGLRRKMPVTFWTFLIATLAISGLPFVTSGFFSKDRIIAACFEHGLSRGGWHMLLPWVTVATAGLTAFYMFRLVALTFFGEPRDHHAHEHAHESPAAMTIPLVILAALSLGPVFTLGGHEGAKGLFSGHGWFLEQVKQPPSALPDAWAAGAHGHGARSHASGHDLAHAAHVWTIWTAIPASLSGIGLALFFYLKRPQIPDAIAARLPGVYTFLLNKWYFDELYQATFVRLTIGLSWLAGRFDAVVVDGIVNAVGRGGAKAARATGRFDNGAVDGTVNAVGFLTYLSGQVLRFVQNGRAPTYLAVLVGGILLLVAGHLSVLGWALLFLACVAATPIVLDLLGGRDE